VSGVSEQIPLRVWLTDEAQLDNYYAGTSANASVLEYLKSNQPDILYLYGPSHSGISHLLIALTKRAEARGEKAQYIPLQEMLEAPAEMLKHLGSLDFLCLDDIDSIAKSDFWQNEVFHLYNELREQGCPMVFGSHSSPSELPITLADLRSRLLSGETWALEELTDEDKVVALQQRATGRGFNLSDGVARYLIDRQRRDMTSLIGILDKLDRLSLEQKKLITLPFVKTLIDSSQDG
jgi:DnaA family protein